MRSTLTNNEKYPQQNHYTIKYIHNNAQKTVTARAAGTCLSILVASQTIHYLTITHLPSITATPQQQTRTNLPSTLPSTPAHNSTKAQWVNNLSSRPLTEAQVPFLARVQEFCCCATILSKRRVYQCSTITLSQTPSKSDRSDQGRKKSTQT